MMQQRTSNLNLASRFREIHRHVSENMWPPLLICYRNAAASRSSVRLLFLTVCLLIGMFVSTQLLDFTILPKAQTFDIITTTIPNIIEIPVNCSKWNHTQTCPNDYYYSKNIKLRDEEQKHTCPDFFRWIHEDLKPWIETGITEESVERAKGVANFRLVIINGTAYIERYKKSVQSRDDFTIWGLLQLMRRYPRMLPDLDIMFECYDYPLVLKKDYSQLNSTEILIPPPLFRYCGDDDSLDIVFPDWSFWGWAEINIKPWDLLLKDLDEGNKRMQWIDREPYAYWKGNPWVVEHRKDLVTCNVSNEHDWNARLYIQDWDQESKQGFKESNLADQCTHRFKIYIEGSAWSVSEKYILACDSVTLMVTPHYYDFFTRGLMPGRHYWPVRMDDKCRSIKFASEWGNNHEQQAKAMGKAASSFIQEDLKMDNVYDYMFHLLTAYSKLMKYKPSVPQNAVELCSETMACTSEGFAKQFMEESSVNRPADVSPCIMQPPYDPQTLNSILDTKLNSIKQVEKWEKLYFEQINQE